MQPRVAVILSGALRTIKKTAIYLKKNVIQHNHVHIFACVQNDTSQSEEEWNTWLAEQFGDHLKSTIWFSHEKYPDWPAHRDRLLEKMHLDGGWKNYLRTSGSMLEYYQLHLAYLEMYHHEGSMGYKYDYLIRARTDTIYNKPVDFHWLNWRDDMISARVLRITSEMESHKMEITNKSVFMYFMNTIISDDIISNIKDLLAEYCPCETETMVDVNDSLALGKYIREGRYILTIRRNNLYVVRRELFDMIPSLAFMYGYYISPYSDAYWFNAECQFRSACYLSCLTIFDYNTLLEDRSLQYADQWNESDFFMDGVCNPKMLFCVVRK
jgi:hypothetical protein